MTPDRFFSLLLVLQSRETTTTAELATQVGVSVRTVLRDVRWLQEAGFPVLVRRGRGGGVTLLPGGPLDTARLTPGERDHLALPGLDDTQREQLGASTDARRAHRKVRSTLRPSADAALPLSAVVTTDNSPWYSRDIEGLPPAALVSDLRRGVRLRVNYRRAEESEATWRVVDPYGLLAKAGRWYLVADSVGRPRLYALERLVDWEPVRAPRRHRPDATLAGVAAELTARWENPEDFTIHATLEARHLGKARRLLGSRLAGVGEANGPWVGITVNGRGVEDVRLLLPFGGSVTVTGPPEARARVRQLAAELLDHHG
ncbi:Predicted DNA-binding transcriptional regulator YafY, contains an HTH and WYL domains [Streptomyces zhaozhouensis]|uniref:Predicted DNA-binding transcriptional regulator YafY, contains an HTH and WYL domains n=1 Tax=Streptomyces zhaozhouensis TaxID=1300267 RepID=A0A286E0C1_9ACTN|nr:WYL domain-containing protein [Streptomyces zhaozhouensis]SOD64349.1 Predicted DNA-binding transcriptional regulator YafY, contains an HTH and WYL domains [Streptomyces zhaozhouensis]